MPSIILSLKTGVSPTDPLWVNDPAFYKAVLARYTSMRTTLNSFGAKTMTTTLVYDSISYSIILNRI